MNSQEAKSILAAWRPGIDDKDPVLAEALRELDRDPELKQWFEQQQTFHASVRESFRQVRVPRDLKDRILSEINIVKMPAFWRRREFWAVAAGFILLLSLSSLWFRPPAEDSFATFRSRMVRSVLREYRMDIVTDDMSRIRGFLASRQAPADCELKGGLSRLTPMGAGLLSWQGQRVSMVCLDGGMKNILFLFIVDRVAVGQPPPDQPVFTPVNQLMTASWTQGECTFVLAASGSADALRKYF